MIPNQYIFWFYISMCNLFLLQQLQNIEHSAYKVVDLLDCEELQLFSSQANVLEEIQLVFLHEDEQCFILLTLLFLFALLKPKSRSLLPSYFGLENTGSEDRHDSWDARLQLIDFFEDCNRFFFIWYFFDDIVDSAFEMHEVTHEVFASLDQLFILELLQRVESERAELLADAFVHLLQSNNIFISTPIQITSVAVRLVKYDACLQIMVVHRELFGFIVEFQCQQVNYRNWNYNLLVMNLNCLAILLVVIGGCSSAVIYIPGVTVDPIIIYQAQTAINRLQANLRATYGTAMQDNFDYYAKTWAANYFLQQLTKTEQLKPYSNIISGQNNTVTSSSSLIIGNNNQVAGNGNYVFTSNFNSAAAGATGNDLVIDQWLIKMAMLKDFNLLLDYLNRPTSYIYKW